MKIVSINELHSEAGEIAIRTDPPINGAIYDKLLAAWQASPLLHDAPVKITNGLCIFRLPEITPELAKAIQELLSTAEQAVQHDADAARQKAEAQKADRRTRVELAARIFGVPIQ
jgi:hypothetical protein